MTDKTKVIEAQIKRLTYAEKVLGVNATGMVELLDGVDYDLYNKWKNGKRVMSSGARAAISMLICMKKSDEAGVSALEVWKNRRTSATTKEVNQ